MGRPALALAIAVALVTACGAVGSSPSEGPETPAPSPTQSPPTPATPTPATPTPATPTPEKATPAPSPIPTPTARPSPVVSPTVAPTPPSTSAAAPYCAVADVLTPDRDYAAHERTYLDWTYMVSREYVPPDLVSAITGRPAPTLRGVESIGAVEIMARAGDPAYSTLLVDAPGASVRGPIFEDLASLRAAATAAGHRLVILSAYRSYELQVQTFDYWTRVGGYEQALRTSARPGHSEHQLGTTVDLGDGSAAPWEYADWAATPTGAWLARNAADHGFVMSFAKGATPVTCYDYEPWHYRWVGRDLARRLAAAGVPLREYQAGRSVP